MSEKKEFISKRKGITYLDLFAGAGGFSEGFMQAYTDDKYYDFRLASDINENCELTHRVRYNKMLGLDTKFMCQDIMEDSFLPNLLKEIGNQEIDVVTGGPSCQSFSLAGRRKKLDKRDDLFYHYLKVIKALRPKYFVMENVKGILTKDEGRIKSAHIDNDTFVESYNNIIEAISDEQILEKTLNAIDKVAEKGDCAEEAKILKESLGILTSTFDECIEYVRKHLRGNKKLLDHLDNLMKEIRLYNIEEPLVLLSSNYGVPQNRERVVFIGCRNDQNVINEIPPTVAEKDKVKVYEALWDLNMVGNGETATSYKKPELVPEFESTKVRRAIQGKPDERGLLFSEWSRKGRLEHRFIFDEEPFYVPNMNELDKPTKHQHMELFNHQTSRQNDTVRERLRIIASHGDYDDAKAELKEKGLESQKRNYVVLNPLGQSPTVCTMPDDFIHYSAYRPTTVREMARLQSFDDSFVFQGKRQTGGNNRQKEIPQYTLVGNAVPPLMARAIANTLLKHINEVSRKPQCEIYTSGLANY